ncbi:MAG TPA: phosphoglucosamine mutase [Bdellovibrionales bacterium]|nr:phosphoglucosamine mutase [Pseudobdellovibrionaceae bacterium]HAG91671.1 phosphoglucosamine mutase [Bdellovibrionales bacterium]|tara:strand:- start:137 stop:1495 length:1359 start_codon:yes stop_codon:yes gene_type:complete
MKLFGTDGIRGTANTHPMTPDVVMKVGQALGYLLRQQPSRKGDRRMVLIGKDTRLSGYMLEQALSSGLNSMGVGVQLTGPLPTPGIGFLARNMRVDAGVIISASHNAYGDNGIKIFGPDGFKISQEMEKKIEELVASDSLNDHLADTDEIGRTRRIDDADGRYIVFAKNSFPLLSDLENLRIVLDCANGAAYKVAPAIFSELGAEVVVLGNQPSGYNINDKSGALYPSRTQEAVLKYRADVGISLDGDADRVIMVDEKGEILNGDHILAICAIFLKNNGKLRSNKVVATQMSNVGFDLAMKKHGISVLRTDVGDKYVVEAMRAEGLSLGGEQSGHIIHLDHATTGDGCVAALNVLSVMRETKQPLSELRKIMDDVPQVLINTKVSKRVDLSKVPGFQEKLEEVEKALDGAGRVFVRMSGTEPVVRILVEGPNERKISSLAGEIAEYLQKHVS